MINRYFTETMSNLHREVKIWRIKVVYRGTPNADGFWIDCGTHQFPSHMTFKENVNRSARFIPRDHECVMVESR